MDELTSALPATETSPDTADGAGEVRSHLLQLQALVTVVLSYQLLFSTDALLTEEAQRVAILVLMLVCGTMIVLPDWMIAAEWFPGGLALTDTVITTVLLYLSGNASSELYLTYFVILLIATTSRMRIQLAAFIFLVCAVYGMVLFRQFLETGTVSETQLLRIPLFIIMAVFYCETANRARTLSECDALTGLPNRRSFLRSLSRMFVDNPSQSGAALSLDLDGFTLLNDTLGEEVGDRVLRAMAGRLKSALAPSMVLARLGGDEFGIAVPGRSDEADLRAIVEKLLARVSEPITVESREVFLSACIGLAIYPHHGDSPKVLLRCADAAMHRAKEQGKNRYRLYASDMNANISERFILETNLRRALDRKELAVYYQPLVELATGRITGVEALLRWLHPTLGLILPERFLAIAEDTGMIVPIGAWMLETACRDMRSWHQRGFPDLSLTVNLSLRQLQDPQLAKQIEQVLSGTMLPPQSLTVELMESSITQGPDRAAERLTELTALGVRISIADFGTGYASLSHLKGFSIDALKIDRRLIHDIVSNDDTVAIVAAMVAMAQRLRLKVVAEGVETERQAARLREQGCREAQGYAFSQPLAAGEMEQLLREWALHNSLGRSSATSGR